MFSEIPGHLNAGARGLLLPALVALLILADFSLAAEPSAEAIRAIRVWPAQDYTRVTVESGQPLKHNLLRVRDPERLVLDLKMSICRACSKVSPTRSPRTTPT